MDFWPVPGHEAVKAWCKQYSVDGMLSMLIFEMFRKRLLSLSPVTGLIQDDMPEMCSLAILHPVV
ncbi:hypothetical protein C0J52_12890 [Blattella germanica]|nr:hypothetical protein C0J52_12890 [Blattella germanica]